MTRTEKNQDKAIIKLKNLSYAGESETCHTQESHISFAKKPVDFCLYFNKNIVIIFLYKFTNLDYLKN